MQSHSNGVTGFEKRVIAYANWVIRWRWAVLLVTLAVTAVLASGAGNLWFATNYRAFFSDDNPQLTAFEALQDVYTKNDNVLFVLAPEEEQVFRPEALEAVIDLTEASWQLPYSIRVDAISNFQHTYSQEDDLIVEDLISEPKSLSPEDLKKARAIALDEPILNNRLINEASKVTGVNVTFQLPGKDINEVSEVVGKARELAAQMEAKYGLKIYLTGMVMMNNAFSESGLGDMQTLVPLMYGVMLVVMLVLLRSIGGTVVTLLVITLSTMAAMGMAGWFKTGLTPPSAQAPTMIMTLAIADSIHILVTMLREMRQGREKREALVESLRVNIQPVFLTSVTTAIGFLTMNFSEVPPFNHLGNITAFGVLAAFINSVFFLPAFISVIPLRVRQRAARERGFFTRFGTFAVRRRRILLWGSTALVFVMSALITRNELNDDFVKYFDESISFRTDTDFTVENLSGIYNVEFSVPAGESGGISNPEYLRKLDEFEAWWKEQPEVLHVNSFTDIMKRLNRNMHGDDRAYHSIPADRELAAQYVLLYEMSLPYGLDLNNQINVDKSATRFTVTLKTLSSREMRELSLKAENWLKENAPEYMHTKAASTTLMFSYISGRNIDSMLTGTTIALILISLLLIFALRSPKFGLMSLIPNLVPAAMAFGFWGLTVSQVNLGLSLVIGMTLGIIVDDTIHFLSKYLRARREKQLDAKEAVVYAFSSVGSALAITSAILIAGFGILSLSSFDMNAGMGKMAALTILFALVADFLMLPAVLVSFDRQKAASPASPPALSDPGVVAPSS